MRLELGAQSVSGANVQSGEVPCADVHRSQDDVSSNAAATHFSHPQACREIHFGQVTVAYAVQRSKRRTVGVIVCRQGLTVRAPHWVSYLDIETVLRAKQSWICRKLFDQDIRARNEKDALLDWKSGVCVPFLGQFIQVILSPGVGCATLSPEVRVDPGSGRPVSHVLHLGLSPVSDPEEVREAVFAWMRQYARAHFKDRIHHFSQKLQVRVNGFSLTSARTRWGSASSNGSIRLHWRLVHFDPDIVDYVVVHELSHLHEMNHGPRFWALVGAVLPGYEGSRAKLKKIVLPN